MAAPTPGSPCPICKKSTRPRAENPAAPFCSARCRQIDLGKWLNEEYRVPTAEESREETGDSNEEAS